MATLASIFALEENLTAAVKTVLLAYDATLTVFAPAVDELTQDDELSVPRVDIGCEIGGNTEYSTPDANRYFGEWKASVSCRVATDRVRGQDHKGIRGAVRAAMHTSTSAQWAAALASYDMAKIEETGTSYSFDNDNKLDFTELNFDLVFRVKLTDWP